MCQEYGYFRLLEGQHKLACGNPTDWHKTAIVWDWLLRSSHDNIQWVLKATDVIPNWSITLTFFPITLANQAWIVNGHQCHRPILFLWVSEPSELYHIITLISVQLNQLRPVLVCEMKLTSGWHSANDSTFIFCSDCSASSLSKCITVSYVSTQLAKQPLFWTV